jgi:hypothetical protein
MPASAECELIGRVQRALPEDGDIDALLLTESIGRDADDDYSDVDFLLAVADGRFMTRQRYHPAREARHLFTHLNQRERMLSDENRCERNYLRIPYQ